MTKPDRDVYVPKHPTPAAGVPAFVTEEGTGVVEGEALRAIRARRPTPERLQRLEDKHDELATVVTETRLELADFRGEFREMRGEIKTALGLIVPERQQVHTTHRAKIDSRTKIVIAIGGAICTLIGVVITAMAGCA